MPVPVEKSEALTGQARVQMDERFVYVTFLEKQDKTYRIFREDCPSYLVNHGACTVIISMPTDGTKIYNARPIKGTHPVKIVEFKHEKDKPPMVKVQQGRMWEGKRIPDQVVFDVILGIEYGEYKGFQLSYRAPYAFKEFTAEGGQVVAGISGKGMERCSLFCEKFGMDFAIDTIPMSDNILPWLEQFFLKKGKVVLAELNDKGYVDAFTDVPSGMVFADVVPTQVQPVPVQTYSMPPETLYQMVDKQGYVNPQLTLKPVDEEAKKILRDLGYEV
jgi:hypothetical protein